MLTPDDTFILSLQINLYIKKLLKHYFEIIKSEHNYLTWSLSVMDVTVSQNK